MEALSREFRVALPWELLYADDLVVIAETEHDLIKRLNEWKNNVENRGMRVNMNKTKVMISGRLYSGRVQSSTGMLHGSETWPIRKENEVAPDDMGGKRGSGKRGTR